MEYLGIVLDTNDPLKIGRVKIRVRGVYDTISEDLIPWALPRYIGQNHHDLPIVGSEVSVKFLNNDIHIPTWFSGGGYNNDYTLSDTDYQSGAILLHKDLSLYDSDGMVSVRFEDSVGVTLSLDKDNVNTTILIGSDGTIKINADSRFIHVTGDMISLGQENQSDEPAVLGDKNADMLDALNDQDNTIVSFLTSFLTQLAAAATPNPYTSAIGALATSSIPKLQADFLPDYTKNKTDIPQTKSTKTSLD